MSEETKAEIRFECNEYQGRLDDVDVIVFVTNVSRGSNRGVENE